VGDNMFSFLNTWTITESMSLSQLCFEEGVNSVITWYGDGFLFRNRKVCVNDTPAYNCRIYYETSSESRLRSLPICLWMLHISRKSRAIFSAYRPVWKQWINFVQRYDDIFSKSQSRSKTGQVTFIVPRLKVLSTWMLNQISKKKNHYL